jgi:hypothetical protein
MSHGSRATINRIGVLRGKAGRPIAEGFSRTIHYEISGAAPIGVVDTKPKPAEPASDVTSASQH